MHHYTIADRNRFIFETPRVRAYRIYDRPLKTMPDGEKPREKLKKYGPQNLSLQELFAILLGSGTKKEDVLKMAVRVAREYGEKSVVAQRDPDALSRNLGVPPVKAAQIVACAEIGRRFYDKRTPGITVIRTAKDVFEHTRDMRDLPNEQLRGLYLNAHHRLIHDAVIAIGTVNASVIHPREVFKPAIDYAAVAVVLVHNHPSGVAKASADDIEITRQLVESGKTLGIDLLDHVIVTKTRFSSVPVEYE